VRRRGALGFEVDEGDENDLSDLGALIAAANRPEGDFSERLEDVADLEQMVLMWAVERYIGHWDGYSASANNYYLHSDAAGEFKMLPWGTDQAWIRNERSRFGRAGALLFNRCLRDRSCAKLYRWSLRAGRSAVIAADLDTLAVETAAGLEPWQLIDPRRPYSFEEISAAVDATRAFIASRPANLARWLAR
jgi:hypothetical protein